MVWERRPERERSVMRHQAQEETVLTGKQCLPEPFQPRTNASAANLVEKVLKTGDG
jgi:hypothetical protein